MSDPERKTVENMSSYDLIKDLEKKLTLYRNTHKWRVASPNLMHEKIAHYISIADIYPRPLNRHNVKALLEGRDSWPSAEGAEFCIAYRTDIIELEQARVIAFPSDSLIVQPRVQSTPGMPPTLRRQLDAHNLLYEIRYYHEDYASPHLWLEQILVDPADLPFVQQNLKPRGQGYRLRVKREDVAGVGTYLWKQLIAAAQTPDEAFAEYVSKMQLAAGEASIFEIDFELDIEIQQFLECAFNYIALDNTIFETWEGCATDVALNHNRIDAIIKKPSLRKKTLSPGQPSEMNAPEESYCDALDTSQLKNIVQNLTSRPPTTLLEGGEWWSNVKDYRFTSRETASEYLIHLILRHEHNLYNYQNSFPITRKLIKLAPRAPKLLGALFTDPTYPAYVCFLLSDPETNHLGLINVYRSLERNPRPISEHTSYEQLWNDLIWTQALEVFQKSYNKIFSASDLPDLVGRLCEMLAWFASHELDYNSRNKLITDTRIPALKDMLEHIHYLGPSGRYQTLIEYQRKLFIDTVKKRLSMERGMIEGLPLGEWLILIWSLNWTKVSSDPEDCTIDDIQETCGILIKSYLDVLQKRMSGNATATDDPLAFDQIDWIKVYNSASFEQRELWLDALNDHTTIDCNQNTQKSREIVFSARMHCRLLLQLYIHSEHTEKSKLSNKILEISQRFGFDTARHSGIFDYLHDNSDYSPVRLWQDVCNAANNFSHSDFKHLIGILRETEAPLSALFVLLERTASHSSKKLVVALIAERNLEEASPNWTPEAFEIILKAANNGQMKIAREYLAYVKNHSHKTFNTKVIEISAKLDLKEIFDRKPLLDKDKIRKLIEYEFCSDERAVINEVNNFRRYLIASLTMHSDHAKALTMFSSELDKEQTLQNATGLIRVVLCWPSTLDLPAPLEFYRKRWIDTYESTFESDAKAKLSDVELNFILQLCIATSHLEHFKRFWNVASNQQRMAYELAPSRAEYLKRTVGSSEALAYMQELRELHQPLPQDVLETFISIEESLKNDGAVVITKLQTPTSPEIGSRSDRLRAAWCDIRELGAYEQSQIFKASADRIDSYLIEMVEIVGLELLKRAANLQRKKSTAPSPSTIMLDEENMINDWFVSLVSHRMAFAGWKMSDQTRIGRSGSGNGVGECDGLVEDSTQKPVFLFEAFRLGNHINSSAINEHLNKLSKYNSVGVSTIFIVVYIASHNFSSLCSRYKDHVEGIDYEGFETGSGSGLTKRDDPSKNIAATYYEETRRVNGNDVSIYHHLLHFSPPN
ncbi:hypothetical protein [Pseudomonas shirazensis]|uniref:hypothetical protein n=1 Tax=Pseudomonas shirazensis TaxID=2745494 RepID=UPI0039883E18